MRVFLVILVTGTVFAQEELGRALDRTHEHGLDMTHGHDLDMTHRHGLDMTYRQALDCPMVDKRIIGELTDMQPEISSWEECGELKHKQNDENWLKSASSSKLFVQLKNIWFV